MNKLSIRHEGNTEMNVAVSLNGEPVLFDGFCIECGAETVLDAGLICMGGEHVFRVNPWGYCHDCGRNGISCECNDCSCGLALGHKGECDEFDLFS